MFSVLLYSIMKNLKNSSQVSFAPLLVLESEVGRLVPDLFLFFKKALYEVNVSALQFNFNMFDSP